MPVSFVVKSEGLKSDSLVNMQQNNVTENAPDLVDALISDGVAIEIREADGYVNATKMAARAGTFWGHYFEIQDTQKFLAELALNIDMSIISPLAGSSCLVDSRRGRYGGTWVHPKVAIHFAGWISPKFAVAVVNLVDRFTKGEVTTKESKVIKAKIDKGKEKGKGKDKVEKVRRQDMYSDEWWVYVRCYLPGANSKEVTSSDLVLLNLELLKFGVTGVLCTRSDAYSNDQGYFAFAFRCKNFSEAKKVEDITSGYFSGCKLGTKHEYLRVPEAAATVGLYIDEAGATQRQYADVALHIFAKMVKTLHDINPDHRGRYGYTFEVKSTVDTGGSSSSTVPAPTLTRREIGRAHV